MATALITTFYGSLLANWICGPVGNKLKSKNAAEISAAGKSIFTYDPKGKVAEAYKSLAKEVLADADRQRKLSSERAR